jgi:hypothetical protein
MATTISCPSCGKQIEVTQALVHQVEDQITAELEQKHKQELQKLEQNLEKHLKQKLEEKNALELSDLKKQLEEKEAKVKELRNEELALREQKRKLEEREKDMELEMARKMDQERKKAEETIYKQMQETHRLKEAEKEKVISDLQKALEDAQRKAQQGSQQTQGEVAELDLEVALHSAFPTDTITPVEKGVRGADIRQVVTTTIGNVCGTILWESKRTKAWSHEWITKLKADLRAEKAHIPIILSSVLPDTISSGFGYIEGVYVVNHELAIPIASVLRQKLIDIAREKFIIQNKEGSSERLYEYITSHEFRQHIEAVVEVYKDMQTQILKEKTAYERIWKLREAQIQKLWTSTAGIVGSIQGRIGQSMPSIKGLDLLEEPEEQEQLL